MSPVIDALSSLGSILAWVISNLWWIAVIALLLLFFKLYSIFKPVIDPILEIIGKGLKTPFGKGVLDRKSVV